MKKWHRYELSLAVAGSNDANKHNYSIDVPENLFDPLLDINQCRSREDFFQRYLFDFQHHRLVYHLNLLGNCLRKNENILSIASGGCSLELFLNERGYNITCSDVSKSDYHDRIKLFFPDFRFQEYNVLSGPTQDKYDAVICISLIYLFDQTEYSKMLKNIHASLKPGGTLILDSAGSPDNFMATIYHSFVLAVYAFIRQIGKTIKQRKRFNLKVVDGGYRRRDEEIVAPARECGFDLIDRYDDAFLMDFRRVHYFNNLIDASPFCNKLFIGLGKKMPYIRLFKFKKGTG